MAVHGLIRGVVVGLAWTVVSAVGSVQVAQVAQAAEVSVAVAANFTAPMQQIAAAFARDTGHHAVLSFGSTGKFYAQIKNGAPFQVLLAADAQTPARLESEGLAAPGTRFTYAIGRLVLWSRQPGLVDAVGGVLRTGTFERIAIANPKLAPYGAAAMQVLEQRHLLPRLQARLVRGENIAQTYQFVDSGNAALGFVALSQVMAQGRITEGSAWVVPGELHTPLRQDAMVLAQGKNHAAAHALLAYLKSDTARSIMNGFGYEVPN